MKEFSAKASQFASSGIREWSIIAKEHNAINLAQGYPEFDPPKFLTDTLAGVAETGPHQYTPNWGTSQLRAAVAGKQSEKLGRTVDPSQEILITCGSTEAMMATFMALFDPGDKVILFSPYYSSYLADAYIVGATPILVELRPPEFKFDPQALEDAFRQNPKAIILCNPSNPSGKVFTREELLIIADLAKRYDTYVVTDEVYEYIVYPPHKHIYFASLPGMFERTISCSSLSKTFSVTGWRLGFITAPHEFLTEIRKFHDFFIVCAPSPLQVAASAGFKAPQAYYDELAALYAKKRKILLDGLDAAGIPHSDPEGAYFVLADISRFGYRTDVEFCRLLVTKYGISTVPGSCFFSGNEHRYIRLHFAKNDQTLYAVNERLLQLERDFV